MNGKVAAKLHGMMNLMKENPELISIDDTCRILGIKEEQENHDCDLLDMNLNNALKQKRIYGGFDMVSDHHRDAMRYTAGAERCDMPRDKSGKEKYTLFKDEIGHWSLIEESGDDALVDLGKDEMLMILAQVLIGAKDKSPYKNWAKSKRRCQESVRVIGRVNEIHKTEIF